MIKISFTYNSQSIYSLVKRPVTLISPNILFQEQEKENLKCKIIPSVCYLYISLFIHYLVHHHSGYFCWYRDIILTFTNSTIKTSHFTVHSSDLPFVLRPIRYMISSDKTRFLCRPRYQDLSSSRTGESLCSHSGPPTSSYSLSPSSPSVFPHSRSNNSRNIWYLSWSPKRGVYTTLL